MKYDLIIIGAGAGGCFSAIRLAEIFPQAKILILEAARKPLGKVEISGGGRCNVTHACFKPETLIGYYPRGGKEMLQPFNTFQPRDMINWFSAHGIKIKKEKDGRMFPESDSSVTIINCFLKEIKKHNIELRTSTRASSWKKDAGNDWVVDLYDGKQEIAHQLLISSGSDQRTWDYLKASGHTIIAPVPSLFTFNIKDKALLELQGISKSEVTVSLQQFKLSAEGPVLITHWGLSGPGILKLSAWGARELYACDYTFDLAVKWITDKPDDVKKSISLQCLQQTKKQVHHMNSFDLPSRLWKYLCLKAGISDRMNGSEIGNARIEALVNMLTHDIYRVTGKSTYKDEFVTAGGVALNELKMDRFESKIIPDLYLVGEILNIDALTGGFNFQAAWTGADIAARSIAARLKS